MSRLSINGVHVVGRKERDVECEKLAGLSWRIESSIGRHGATPRKRTPLLLFLAKGEDKGTSKTKRKVKEERTTEKR